MQEKPWYSSCWVENTLVTPQTEGVTPATPPPAGGSQHRSIRYYVGLNFSKSYHEGMRNNMGRSSVPNSNNGYPLYLDISFYPRLLTPLRLLRDQVCGLRGAGSTPTKVMFCYDQMLGDMLKLPRCYSGMMHDAPWKVMTPCRDGTEFSAGGPEFVSVVHKSASMH